MKHYEKPDVFPIRLDVGELVASGKCVMYEGNTSYYDDGIDCRETVGEGDYIANTDLATGCNPYAPLGLS